MSGGPWEGGSIFVPVKVFIAVVPRSPTGPLFTILHAQPNFFSTFKYNVEDAPMPVSALFCRASDRRVVSNLERAMVEGRAMTAYINLQDKNGVILSCHISLIAGGGVTTRDQTTLMDVHGRFTVLTIRSASLVGNCQAIGLMVTEPRSQAALLEARIGVERPAQKVQHEEPALPITSEPGVESKEAGRADA